MTYGSRRPIFQAPPNPLPATWSENLYPKESLRSTVRSNKISHQFSKSQTQKNLNMKVLENQVVDLDLMPGKKKEDLPAEMQGQVDEAG